MSPAGATIAGQASLIRKIATPARTSRISTPAPVVVPAKSRSPGRRLGRGASGCRGVSGGAVVVVTDGSVCSVRASRSGSVCRGAPDGPGRRRDVPGGGAAGCRSSAGRLDRVDDLLRCVPRVRGDRRAARGVGRGLLAVLADHVVLE